MTDAGNSGDNDKKYALKKRGKRDRDHNRDGIPYDRRKGSWSASDRAEMDAERFISEWLTPNRCKAELEILNPPVKRGPRFLYPPSLIMMVALQMSDGQRSYRRAVGAVAVLLERLGLPVPSYSTVHKSEWRFFGTDLGYETMGKAAELMESRGIGEEFDPRMIIRTGVHPNYEGPRIDVDCQAMQDLQDGMDAEAEEMSGMMETVVFRSETSDGRERVAAIDGSGAGVSGPGIYFE